MAQFYVTITKEESYRVEAEDAAEAESQED